MYISEIELDSFSDKELKDLIAVFNIDGRKKYYNFGSSSVKDNYVKCMNLADTLNNNILNICNNLIINDGIINIDMPMSAFSDVQRAVYCKRIGDYYSGLTIYMDLLSKYGLTEALINGLYKLYVSSGLVGYALQLLACSLPIIQKSDFSGSYFQNDLAHFNDLQRVIESESDFILYVKSVSGNIDYTLPYSYDFLIDSLNIARKSLNN